MLRSCLAGLLLLASAVCSATYVSNQHDFVGGYTLTFTNDDSFRSYCKVENSLGDWYTFYVSPYSRFNVTLRGPSRFWWNCVRG